MSRFRKVLGAVCMFPLVALVVVVWRSIVVDMIRNFTEADRFFLLVFGVVILTTLGVGLLSSKSS